jgi:hypothetical protein
MNTDKTTDMTEEVQAVLGVLLSNSFPSRHNLIWSKPFIYSNFISTDPPMRTFGFRHATRRAHWWPLCQQSNSKYPRFISWVFYNQPEEEDI